MASKLRYLGPALLAIAALYLVLSWQQIPEQWIVHWSRHGRPDGVAHKGVIAVFWPLLTGLVLWALIELIAIAGDAATPNRELARANAVLTRTATTSVAAMLAALAVALPLWRTAGPLNLLSIALLLVVAPILAASVYCVREVARLKRAGHRELDGHNGIIYRNPNDERLFVPKLSGLGYTLNFGRRAAWWVMALLLLPVAFGLVVLCGR